MTEFIQNTGPMGIVNLIILFFITIFALKNAFLLYIKKPQENLAKLGRSINSMLFWGAIIVILGFLGTFQGLQSAMDSVLGNGAEANLLLIAIFILLKLVIFSLTSFTIISIVWFIFTARYRKLLEQSMKESYTAD